MSEQHAELSALKRIYKHTNLGLKQKSNTPIANMIYANTLVADELKETRK